MQTGETPNGRRDSIVNVLLRGCRVTATFREALFDASNRSGMSVNEFVLQATAEKLKASGREFSGVFSPGDTSNTFGRNVGGR